MQLKYLIIENGGLPVPILFSELIQHNWVKVDKCSAATSGGFVRLLARDDGGVFAVTHGESVSLRLKPAKGDSELIESYLNKILDLGAGVACNFVESVKHPKRKVRDGNW